ncbi:MAG: HEAT repeat domain-containing protein, partial [Planctomycetes bacterium]|nr:HEAT repeat domain-containing protein [Planctomycetota bacterium]
PAVEDEILAALSVLGIRQGQVDAALAAALHDPVPVRRAAAALVLGQSGNPQQRTAVRALLAETDPQVRFYAARGLIAGRDKSGLPALLPLLTDAPPELALQAEDLLAGLAGKEAPRVGLGEDAGSRRQCRAAWDRWWQTHEDQLDLERLHADAVMFDPALRVRQVGRQFLTALGQGDSAGLVRTMDFPFFLGEGNGEEMSREQFERFIQPLAAEMKQQKVHFTIQKVVSVEEYSRVAPLKEKRYLTTLTRLRLKVVYVEVQREGDRPESGVLFVRLTGGRARVVGIGDGEPRGGATR